MPNYLKLILGGFIGGIAGFTYYYFWGCKNGCPLQSNWMMMTAYGAIAGIILSIPNKKKMKNEQKEK